MNFQSATSDMMAEAVFRTVVSGITKTTTSTVSVLRKGEPVVLATATIGVGALGQEVIRPITSTTVGGRNRLVVGPVASDTIAHEACGLVQVYGIAEVRLQEAATVAAFDYMIPGLNSTATALAAYGQGAWLVETATATNLSHFDSGLKAIVVAAATAVSGTNSYTNGYAFIRGL